MPSLTAAQNITLPLRLAKQKPDKAWLAEVTERVGLADRIKHKPGELSGGQQQRVAIARALVARPEVIFADEPTGALDTRTGKAILSLLRGAVDGLDQTVVMVTHDPIGGRLCRHGRVPRRRRDRRDDGQPLARPRRRAHDAPRGLRAMLRIAFSTLASRKGGTFGAFAAVALAVVLVVSCGILLESSLRAPIPVERLHAAAVVVQGEPDVKPAKARQT